MGEYCIVVADGARARFFSLESAALPGLESGPNLVEQDCLINPEGDTPPHELWSGDKSGPSKSSSGGPSHAFDDHRSRHMDEFMRRYANQITETALRLAKKQHAKKLVLVAEKRMLGFIRQQLVIPPNSKIEVHDLAKDLSKLDLKDIHSHLYKEGLLPKRKGPTG